MKLSLKILSIAIMLVAADTLMAQKRVKLKQADSLVGGTDETGENYNKFIGNVIFTQDETTIHSDSALLYKQRNYVEAFGRVKIIEGDSVTITARKLTYDGNTKKAELRKNVVFNKLKQMTLYTDFLDYDRLRQQAKYFNGGKLVDSINTLTSAKGYYQVNTNMASFKKNVVGTNPDYTMESDTLQYNTQSKIIFFRAPTKLINKDGDIATYNDGTYDTKVRLSSLNQGEVETESYILTGNRLYLDDIRKLYKGIGDVEMISKEQDVIITGDDGYYDKREGIAKVYGNALMKKIMKDDTLYLTADTLMAIENEDPAKKRLLAYYDVKIFKSDLQGIADSMAYFTADSIIYFYQDPVLWTGENQLSADSINVEVANGTINKLNLRVNSFVVSVDSIKNFNQIKGRTMEGYFNAGELDKVDVNGNGESIFFALNDEETAMVGMNRILCSNIVIRFVENKADNLSFYVNPEASFIPPHELEESEQELRGFSWRVKEKPEKDKMLTQVQIKEKLKEKAIQATPQKEDVLNKKEFLKKKPDVKKRSH